MVRTGTLRPGIKDEPQSLRLHSLFLIELRKNVEPLKWSEALSGKTNISITALYNAHRVFSFFLEALFNLPVIVSPSQPQGSLPCSLALDHDISAVSPQ